ncbi:MAG: synthase subunit gamma [Firmicutes bacterium]|nr:synthase subunit gamma [Bacillota bacterium]
MAGAGLLVLKRRIRSITSTQKITKAMGLVATSKLRKTREQLALNEKYYNHFNKIMADAVVGVEDYNVFTHGNKSDKKLYIILASDSGLCGGFNSNVVNEAANALNKDRENSLVITVGQKGKIYLKRHKYETAAEFVDISDVPTLEEAAMITNKALDMYTDGEVGEVYVVYTKFFSAVKQVVTVDKVLPIEKAEGAAVNTFIKIEPAAENLISEVALLYFKQKLLNHMINAKASEQGSRMQAMDGATKNADDLLDALKIRFNRERQGVITQEITEIVGGAEAL